MKEYRGKPENFITPSPEAIKARTRRNIALALCLFGFMLFVFVTMISRGQLPQ